MTVDLLSTTVTLEELDVCVAEVIEAAAVIVPKKEFPLHVSAISHVLKSKAKEGTLLKRQVLIATAKHFGGTMNCYSGLTWDTHYYAFMLGEFIRLHVGQSTIEYDKLYPLLLELAWLVTAYNDPEGSHPSYEVLEDFVKSSKEILLAFLEVGVDGICATPPKFEAGQIVHVITVKGITPKTLNKVTTRVIQDKISTDYFWMDTPLVTEDMFHTKEGALQEFLRRSDMSL